MPSNTSIQWNEEHQVILEALIEHLISPPLMSFPDFSSPFILHTDASESGLGAVLYQRKDGEMKVIAYASRSLKPAEKNYLLYGRHPRLPIDIAFKIELPAPTGSYREYVTKWQNAMKEA